MHLISSMTTISKRILISLFVVGGCLGYLLTFSYTHFGIPCLFRLLTGFLCPGCGITHMCAYIIQGDFKSAFRENAYLFITSPAYIYLCLKLWLCWVQGKAAKWSMWENVLIYVLLVSAIIFGIGRNLSHFIILE